jgi:hypothetical protein
MIGTQIKGSSSWGATDRAEALLAAVLASRWIPERLDDLRSLESRSNTTDWQYAIRFHGLAGILCLHHQAALSMLSPEFRVVPELMVKTNTRNALHHLAITKALVENLGKNNITAVPLKGVVLSHQLYGSIVRRVSSDIDVLVDPDDFEKASAVLVGMGYFTKFDMRSMSQKLKRLLRRHIKDITFFRPGEPRVELHIRNENSVFNSLPRLKNIALEKLAKNSINFFVLPNALLRESVARHALRSNLFRWKWGYDVVECVMQFAGGELALQYTDYHECSRAEHICLNALAQMWGITVWKRSPHSISGAIVASAAREQRRCFTPAGTWLGVSTLAHKVLQLPTGLLAYSRPVHKFDYLISSAFFWHPENGFRRALIVEKCRPMGLVFNMLKLVSWLARLGRARFARTATNAKIS